MFKHTHTGPVPGLAHRFHNTKLPASQWCVCLLFTLHDITQWTQAVYVVYSPPHPQTICQQFTIVPNYPLSLLHTLFRSHWLPRSHTLLCVRCLCFTLAAIANFRGLTEAPNWWVKGQSWRLALQMAETCWRDFQSWEQSSSEMSDIARSLLLWQGSERQEEEVTGSRVTLLTTTDCVIWCDRTAVRLWMRRMAHNGVWLMKRADNDALFVEALVGSQQVNISNSSMSYLGNWADNNRGKWLNQKRGRDHNNNDTNNK